MAAGALSRGSKSDDEVHELQGIDDIVTRHKRVTADVRLAQHYYDGVFRIPFSTPRLRRTYRQLMAGAQTAYCSAVVNAYTARAGASWAGLDTVGPAVIHEMFLAGYAVIAVQAGRPWVQPACQWALPDDTWPATRMWTTGDGARHVAVFPGDGTVRSWAAKTGDAWRPEAEDDGVQLITASRLGGSIIRDIIPIQDQINYLVACELISVDRAVMPLWYILSSMQSALEADAKISMDPSVESILAIVGDQAGAFPTPDIASVQKMRESAEKKVAAVSGMPAYLLDGGTPPSGTALAVASERMTAAVRACQQAADEPLRQAAALTIGADPDGLVWHDPAPTTPADRAAYAGKLRQLGLPPDVWLPAAGVDPQAVCADGRTVLEAVTVADARDAGSLARALYSGGRSGV